MTQSLTGQGRHRGGQDEALKSGLGDNGGSTLTTQPSPVPLTWPDCTLGISTASGSPIFSNRNGWKFTVVTGNPVIE
jgi:hypothetical protein